MQSMDNIDDALISYILLGMFDFPDALNFILTSKRYYHLNINNVKKNYIKCFFPSCIIPLDDIKYCWKQACLWAFMSKLEDTIYTASYDGKYSMAKLIRSLRYVKRESTYFGKVRTHASDVNYRNLIVVRADLTKELENPKYSELKLFIESIECILGKIEDWINYDERLMSYAAPEFDEDELCDCKTCNILLSFSFYNIKPII